jgi:imidazolonepropionase-like amidohydrolase
MNTICKLIIAFTFYNLKLFAQGNIAPAAKQSNPILLSGGTIHVGNGQVINNGFILIADGKIKLISASRIDANATEIDCQNRHIYPGLIAANTTLGLVEVAAIRATHDDTELGSLNPEVRSIPAFNTDNIVINTVRSNGILLAHVIPEGNLLCGSGSVVQLDAWNWEDAAYKVDNSMHIKMPGFLYRKPWWKADAKDDDPEYAKENLLKIDSIIQFFKEAKAYHAESVHQDKNLKFDATKKLFAKEQKLYVHAYTVKEMLIAIHLAQEIECDLVIVGGNDAWMITDLLKKNNVSIILSNPHSLPNTSDDAIDQPFKTAFALQKAGILFSTCMEEEDAFWQIRNLPFLAGTMSAYGLSKEEALQAITLSAAKILGIDDRTGSLEIGKDANIIVSEGDVLDMRTSIIKYAFIQGRQISLENKQTQLFEKYKMKYGLKD